VAYYPRPAAKPLPAQGVAPPMPDSAPDYTFLSSPDFMNCDLADVSTLKRWRPGLPNSWNASYAATVDTILDTFEAEAPEDVFVAGDLVEGHWDRDDFRTGIFGPSRTTSQRRATMKRAADFYFSQWRQRFDERGLPVYAAVGDHDIGDNSWRGRANDFKRKNLSVFKDSLYRNVLAPDRVPNRPTGQAHRTAYATYVDPEVLLVTVDVFQRTKDDVIARLDDAQLRWLDATLERAERRGTDWIVVQGHVPVLTPVRTYGSSAIRYRGGERSDFWRVMAKHHVDIYLNGEVHDISVRRAHGITQISHGGTIQMATPDGRGATNYVLGQIFGDTMWLRDNRFAPKMLDYLGKLWQFGRSHRPIQGKEVWDDPLPVGHLVLTSDNRLLYSDGMLIPLGG
ncbi:MAG TPA: metallophosphoesterase, partial [Nocardioides sp.]|nr:metallophosphoesterase [Nocardioides sp.]